MLILIGGWVGCFGAAVVASTCLIRVGVPFLKSRAERRGPQPDRLTLPESRGGVFDLASVGFWIGFFETLLIFLFIGLGQPTGLGLILAAKGLARKGSTKIRAITCSVFSSTSPSR